MLNTGRVRDQWHTMTRTGRVPHLMTHAAAPRLALHPRDAARRGIADGGLARIESAAGRAVMRAAWTTACAPGERSRRCTGPTSSPRPAPSIGWCMR